MHYEEKYHPEVNNQIQIKEKDGSRLCELHAWPGLSNPQGRNTRHECASSASWNLLSTPVEDVAKGNETLQMSEEFKVRVWQAEHRSRVGPARGDPTLYPPLIVHEDHDEEKEISKWLVAPVFERHGETQQVFLESTKIEGKECLLIDPGAYDNIVGDRWVARQGALACEALLEPEQRVMDRSIDGEGIGTSGQVAKEEVTMPGAAKDEQGEVHQITYNAPVVPDSDRPALWESEV